MTDKTLVELMPCPFCGAQPRWCGDDPKDKHTCHQITCDGCCIQVDINNEVTLTFETLDEVKEAMAKAWNARSKQAFIDEAVQVWTNVTDKAPPKDKRLLMEFYGGIIASCRYREGYLGEPSQGVMAWRTDESGRFGTPLRWAEMPKAMK